MKKIHLTIGALAATTLPIIALFSCGESINNDLKITAQDKTLEETNEVIVALQEKDIDEQQQVELLNKIFKGVTIENFKNFEFNIIETTDTIMGKITLIAKDGFYFGNSKTLESRIKIIDLKITEKTMPQRFIDAAILGLFKPIELPENDRIKLLNTVFNNVTSDNYQYLKLVNYDTYFTLKSTMGYGFSEVTEISTQVGLQILNIVPIPTTKEVILEVFEVIDAGIGSKENLEALRRIFSGTIDIETYEHFSIVMNESKENPEEIIRLLIKNPEESIFSNGEQILLAKLRK